MRAQEFDALPTFCKQLPLEVVNKSLAWLHTTPRTAEDGFALQELEPFAGPDKAKALANCLCKLGRVKLVATLGQPSKYHML